MLPYLRQHVVALMVLAFLLLGAIVSVYVSSIQRDKDVLRARLDMVKRENNRLWQQWRDMPVDLPDSLKSWEGMWIASLMRRVTEQERRIQGLEGR